MSLKIWLPLDGDLRNLGCSGAQIINNEATIDNNGKIGKCYNFDGESQYLQITNFTVDAWPQMTIMFWSNNGPKSVFTLKSGTTSTGNMQFRSTSNSHFYFRDKQHSTETQVALTTTIDANVWAHYAFIYNNGSWQAYINGVLSGEFNAETPTTLNDNNQVLWICNGSTASSSVFKSGKINDFRLYDSALSAAEVHEIAQGLVLHYKLDNIINGIVDSSGYGHNGDIIDTVEVTSNAPRYNKAINYIDNSGGIEIPNMPMQIFNNGNTIAFWIKPNKENDGRSFYCGSYSGTSYSVEKTTANKLRIWWAGSPDVHSSTLTILDDEWQHIAIVKTEDKSSLRLYKNGAYIETISDTFSDQTWSGVYRMGRDTRTTTVAYIGQMSDFRIYCTPLLDTDIKLLYNMGMRIDNLNTLHTFELNEQQYPSPIYSSETGSILTFNNKRLNNLIVNIEPVQNFNGYAKPWPGGSGKNLLPNLIKGIGINSTNGTEITNANYVASDYISVTLTSENSYYISGLSNQLHTFVAAYNSSKEFLGRTSGRTNTGFQITLGNLSNGTPSGTGDIAYLRVTIYKTGTDTGTIDLVDNLQVQLEAGSAATTYEPYSNICPITGWTGATVQHRGKNLLDDTSRYIGGSNNVYLSFEGNYNSFPTFLRAWQYTLSVEFLNGAHYGAYIRNSTKTVDETLWSGKSSTAQVTFTLPYDDYYRIWLYKSDGVSSDNVGHVQLEPGSVATAYEPYQGDTYTVTFPDAAGTIYGGTLDLVAGTLTVDVAYALLNDANKWSEATGTIQFRYDTNFSDRKLYDNSYTGLVCSYYNVNRQTTVNTARWSGASTSKFGIASTTLTLEQVQADAAAGKIAIVYDLAEPVVYTLNSIMLTTLLGTNTFWADSGNITIQYRTPQTARLMKTGTLITEEYQEANKTSIYQNGIVEATEFIEI